MSHLMIVRTDKSVQVKASWDDSRPGMKLTQLATTILLKDVEVLRCEVSGKKLANPYIGALFVNFLGEPVYMLDAQERTAVKIWPRECVRVCWERELVFVVTEKQLLEVIEKAEIDEPELWKIGFEDRPNWWPRMYPPNPADIVRHDRDVRDVRIVREKPKSRLQAVLDMRHDEIHHKDAHFWIADTLAGLEELHRRVIVLEEGPKGPAARAGDHDDEIPEPVDEHGDFQARERNDLVSRVRSMAVDAIENRARMLWAVRISAGYATTFRDDYILCHHGSLDTADVRVLRDTGIEHGDIEPVYGLAPTAGA